ncbi:MAG: EAL domain-containing protein [Chlorogloeopsis fritschii C42_A2020_084]|uniref:EAL domain-containing protein n=1 Tax=Chlorogloeopsis fritschii TaxID=1124 RepID=UPI0019EE8EC3|nr:EAL domain-containing protein [Chlorogloeopsis fritschii]MBF2006128.1 EAL domain-containing protein [Chlorogloeopsis fritschii C42_A2020_084]
MPENEQEKIWHLLVVQDLQGQRTIPLKEATYSLGRDSRNAIVLRSRLVSRQHAILLRVTLPETDQYAFRIVDGSFKGKQSTNGLFINGTKCFSHDLQHGDLIEFGNNQVKAQYYAISNLSEQEFSESYVVEHLSELLLESGNSINPFETLIVQDDSLERASEVALARLASFPELIPNPIIEMDLEGTITYLNPSATLKFPDLKKSGKHHPFIAELVTTVKNHKENSFIREVEVGKAVFEQSVHYLPESDLIRTFVIREITEQKQAEAELHQRDRLLQAVAEAANYLLVEMNYEIAIEKALAVLGEAAQVDRVYLFENNSHPVTGEMAMNLRFEWTCGRVESCRRNWQNQPYNNSGLSHWYAAFSKGESISGLTRELSTAEQEILQRDGIQSLLLVPLRLEEKFWGFLGLVDCSQERYWSKHEESTLLTLAANMSAARQRQQVEEMIRYQALHDLLTGLPNRLLFNEQLAKTLANVARRKESLAVMFLDLDRFKTINDSLGHTLGDLLLQSVAQRVNDSLRAGDTVARWGGDEFIILLPRITRIEEVTQVAKRILQALEKAFLIEGNELYISASLGIALLNEHSPDAETLIQHADLALYHAKDKGRNNYQFYTTSISSKAPEVLTIEKSLRHALEREEFVVYYQPQINIHTGKITGMEALLRWQHPEMGLVAPNIFIPLAEESGLIVPIGEWVLRTACMQNKAWQNAGLPPLTVAVNLSLKQFREPKLVQTVAQILEQTELEPRFLELEITETVAIEDLNFTKKVLQELEQMGVHLSIDDFGTGYSSLSRLQLLPLHNLKIDRSFIRELTTDVKVAHIVKAIVTLGRNLGLRLTAEGVEKEEELEFLKSINCEDVQGFLFYKPLSAQKATEILENTIANSHKCSSEQG